ncbi:MULTISPECIES: redox-sensing transcriptional repressor Rex [Apilactobacillus]|uniref:Redox-sensing transcriptional repressor Rex n=2 Tax=Apilactobacillus TaxID=2767877 RepID=A0A9Q8MTU5_9LACO|nr:MULTISPECIES: redox-sensing transcriptional repressor Rex [Apilactobacillus]TPR12551.1 redox-sensing transcriptional repressor Rex [Apilactobacillus timberlakei]TPR13382.1 redox-sensing transcriptional repressor Rex [Apilactobacillus timberlakei]TPR15455.1 redox-sensing transcriptional repressor Rex [Apilactobacillus timberlakei]TPR17714.1 redox-sensing transcriptional repressor Rex [Apilactobacillus timberlakei]TPR17931.1 redox-sensing transcriptional repressor Rex [Apilactobacillus timber
MDMKIPRATAKRLPMYYRYLSGLHGAKVKRISSSTFADAVQVDSATIRRDLSYFGALGKRGYGYDVDDLLDFFKKILNQDHLTNAALVGLGNLGQALLHFNFHKDSNVRISAAFDIHDNMINTVQSGVPVYDVNDLEKQLSEQQIEVVILTVPTGVAQKICDQAIAGGAKGIMNFTSKRLSAPKNVRVQNVDLTNELQTLIYFIEHYDN